MPPPPRELAEGPRFARGCLWALGPSLVLWGLVVGLLVWLCSCSGG